MSLLSEMNKTFDKTDTFERKHTADALAGSSRSVGLTSSITENHKQKRLVSIVYGICKPPLESKFEYSMFSVSPTSKSHQHCHVFSFKLLGDISKNKCSHFLHASHC